MRGEIHIRSTCNTCRYGASAWNMTGGTRAEIANGRKQVQTVPHTIYQRGDGAIKLPEIVNTVEISGEVFEFSTLPDEKKREIAMQIQDTLMAIAGYKRRTA